MKPSNRKFGLVLIVVVTIGIGWRVFAHFQQLAEESAWQIAGHDPRLAAIRDAMARIRPLGQPIAASSPGDWLSDHPEPGQPFVEYLAQTAKPVSERYATIYVQPLGKFTPTQEKVVIQVVTAMEAFYGLPVKVLDSLPLPDASQKARRQGADGQVQWHAPFLIEKLLLSRRKDDAAAVLGLIADDLWPGAGWNYAFGQSSLHDRVGVWSLARLGDPNGSEADYRLCLRRTTAVALHETGHMLGILHCTAYSCGMNGANNLREFDRHPLDFCPECTAKVWWTCRLDPKPRYRALVEWAEQHGLTADAADWRRGLDLCP